MRTAVLVIGAIELLVLALAIGRLVLQGIRSDLAGQGLGIAAAVIGAGLVLLLAGPALLLAWHGKWLVFALVLVLLASFGTVMVLVAG